MIWWYCVVFWSAYLVTLGLALIHASGGPRRPDDAAWRRERELQRLSAGGW